MERVLPEAVRGTRSLRLRLIWQAFAERLPAEEIDVVVSSLPQNLLGVRCFRDPLTNRWRYEFGQPFTLDATEKLLLGTHMWTPVATLLAVMRCACNRLRVDKRSQYLRRLADPVKHQDTLAEMAPLLRVVGLVPADFEVSGDGVGNRTIDWKIGPVLGRTVLVDVKDRIGDLLQLLDRQYVEGTDGIAAAPIHDAGSLFRSVDIKLRAVDPVSCLQGVWILTQVKQEDVELENAFSSLDPTKVHFAILGDFERDVHMLARHADDKRFLTDLFGVTESKRFTFKRNAVGV
jgi:hypothetical protein